MRLAAVAGSLGISLAAISAGWAQEAQWRAAGSPRPATAAVAMPAERATLGPPTAVSSAGPTEVRTAHFRSAAQAPSASAIEPAGLATSAALIRGQSPDPIPEPIRTMPREAPPGTAAPIIRRQSDWHDAGGFAPAPAVVSNAPAGDVAVGSPGDCICGPGCCCLDPCGIDGCGTGAFQFYGSAEFLIWRFKDADLPPLVTAGTAASLGVLGEPGTVILFGGNDEGFSTFKGGRFTAGWWFDPCQDTCAIEGSFFFLAEKTKSFIAGGDGDPIISRPFFDVSQNTQNAELVAAPGVLTGNVNVRLASRLWGAELNLRRHLYTGAACRIEGLLGFRFLELKEGLSITENLRVPATAQVDPGVGFLVSDRFDTLNRFYGGQIGTKVEFRRGRWGLDLQGKLALGTMNQKVRIDGSTVFEVPGQGTFFAAGGLLAQPTNIGVHRREVFAVVPELGVNLSYYLTDNLRVYAGYSFLFMNNVLRPGDQIDFSVNPTQLPSTAGPGQLVGPARPALLFRETDFFAHGANFGLEYRY